MVLRDKQGISNNTHSQVCMPTSASLSYANGSRWRRASGSVLKRVSPAEFQQCHPSCDCWAADPFKVIFLQYRQRFASEAIGNKVGAPPAPKSGQILSRHTGICKCSSCLSRETENRRTAEVAIPTPFVNRISLIG